METLVIHKFCEECGRHVMPLNKADACPICGSHRLTEYPKEIYADNWVAIQETQDGFALVASEQSRNKCIKMASMAYGLQNRTAPLCSEMVAAISKSTTVEDMLWAFYGVKSIKSIETALQSKSYIRDGDTQWRICQAAALIHNNTSKAMSKNTTQISVDKMFGVSNNIFTIGTENSYSLSVDGIVPSVGTGIGKDRLHNALNEAMQERGQVDIDHIQEVFIRILHPAENPLTVYETPDIVDFAKQFSPKTKFQFGLKEQSELEEVKVELYLVTD